MDTLDVQSIYPVNNNFFFFSFDESPSAGIMQIGMMIWQTAISWTPWDPERESTVWSK